jgi:hypothetical protein
VNWVNFLYESSHWILGVVRFFEFY